MHALEHKECGDTGRTSFDGLCCDGSANYAQLLWRRGGWEVADLKARSFRGEARQLLADWIVRVYSADDYDGPPPIVESAGLLKYDEAGRAARTALTDIRLQRAMRWLDEDEAPVVVYFPLGLERRRVQAYKVIKPSAFLFKRPQQREAFVRMMDKFAEQTSCGLELLALRRSSDERQHGSVADVAEALYRMIRGAR
jgi:hypothetical protein